MILFIIILVIVVLLLIAMNSNKTKKYEQQQDKYAEYVEPPREEHRYIETKIPNAERTKEGWIYVISNLGSFGEGIYKVGMTRRDDPQVRVNELGDASVPFPFDVHAYIWTEDAPALESKLHKSLKKHMYNKVNKRKEFFKVDLEIIRDLVVASGFALEEFDMDHDADQYYESYPKIKLNEEMD